MTDQSYYENWHPHLVPFWRRATTIDGAKTNGPVMRRSVCNDFEYREMTQKERTEYEADKAW